MQSVPVAAPSATAAPSPKASRSSLALAAPILALLSLVSLFLPVASAEIFGQSVSVNFFEQSMVLGIVLAVVYAAGAGIGAAAILKRTATLIRGTDLGGTVLGVIGLVLGGVVAYFAEHEGLGGAGSSIGVGLVLFLVGSLGFVGVSLWLLVTRGQKSAAAPAQAAAPVQMVAVAPGVAPGAVAVSGPVAVSAPVVASAPAAASAPGAASAPVPPVPPAPPAAAEASASSVSSATSASEPSTPEGGSGA